MKEAALYPGLESPMSGSFLCSRPIMCPHHGTPLLTWDFAHAGLPFRNTLPQVSSFRAQRKALLFCGPLPWFLPASFHWGFFPLPPPFSHHYSTRFLHSILYLAYLFVPTLIQSLVLRAVLGAGDTARNNPDSHSLAQLPVRSTRQKLHLFFGPQAWHREGAQ